MTSHIRKEATCPSHRAISLTAKTKAKCPTQHSKLMSNPQQSITIVIVYLSIYIYINQGDQTQAIMQIYNAIQEESRWRNQCHVLQILILIDLGIESEGTVEEMSHQMF